MPKSASKKSHGDAGATILLVDDDEAFAYAVTKYLQGVGYHVINPPHSMAALNEFDKLLDQVDCLVLDIVMPKGMPHGLSLASMARSRKPDIPIVFLTAYADMEPIVKEYGASCLSKPVEFEEIAAQIKFQISTRN